MPIAAGEPYGASPTMGVVLDAMPLGIQPSMVDDGGQLWKSPGVSRTYVLLWRSELAIMT